MPRWCPSACRSCAASWSSDRRAGRSSSTKNSRDNIAHHYDLSNDLFELFLDPTLSYSSALFDGEPTAVRAAPTSRRRRAARSSGCSTRPASAEGTRLLEIGSGWGELAIRAARRGATVTSITLSAEQKALAEERIAAAGLHRPGRGRALRLPRRQRRVRRRRVGRDDRGRRLAVLADLLRDHRPGAGARRPGRPSRRSRCRTTGCSRPATPTPGSTSTSSPAASCRRCSVIDEITREHTALRMVDRLSMGQHYAETLRLWDEAFLGRVRAGARARLRRDLPADVALLPGVLAAPASPRRTSTSTS